ncbi:MAG3720 family protein [Mycoplasmopsis verecunda]|uniref:Uncharacterized protein n=1 Tax=Mycoplasmopsis verecunda TaxID=171291 RepID=A0A1T4MD22_9BACT|nr:hypothetical protein [Mycoplasmopsis verecunda]SJZ64822.1 hypothetical protein SAMN02745154_00688 [Mycoplasmopsis verecunda]
MKKYFINFHIRSNECFCAFIKNISNNYLNIKLNTNSQISYQNVTELTTWHDEVMSEVKNIINNEQLIINYVFDDNIFPNLEQKIMVNKLNCSKISCDAKTLHDLFDKKNQLLAHSKTIEDFISTSPINYMMQKNEIIKEYRDIPKNREAETITQYLSTFSTNLNDKLNDFKSIFSPKIPNSKINYFLKSQILSFNIKDMPTNSLITDIEQNYISYFVVKNGSVLTYNKIPYGYGLLQHYLNDDHMSKLKYLIKHSQEHITQDLSQEEILEIKAISKIYNEYKNVLLQALVQHIIKSYKNPLISNLNHIAFTGQFAWMVSDIEKTFFTHFNKYNMIVQSINNASNFKLFALEDIILEQVVLATNNSRKETIQNNTIMSKIDYTHPKAKSNFISKFMSKINIFK